MRLEPVNRWILGRALVTKMKGAIIAPDPAKQTTRCYLIEAVSEGVTDYKPGDIVVAKHCFDKFFYGGTYHRVSFLPEEIMHRVREVTLDEFVGIDGKPLKPQEGAAA